MPIHFDNVQHLGNKGITITRSKDVCVPLSILTPPIISGVVEVGQTLTCTDGTYAGSTPYYIYNISWYNTSGLVQSGLSNSYEIQASDEGQQLQVVVQAYNCAGVGSAVNNASAQTIPVPAPFDYLFDVFASYSVTPRAAYSFRKLNSAYTGACCRIRRSNDNAELDIGFVSNVVDVASIQAFVPLGASGQIVYIYDQSGNGRHRYQSVANRQPDIIDTAGVVKTQNGKVATHLNNSSRMLQQSTTILPENATYAAFNVYNENVYQNNILFVGGVNQWAFFSIGGGASPYSYFTALLNKVNDNVVTIVNRSQCYYHLTNIGGLIAHYCDFTLQSSWGSNFWFGGYGVVGGTYDWLGYYAEEVYCDGSQVSNSALSADVYANQNAYFGVTQNLLLDLYPSVKAAYSLRRLRSYYTGSAIRVRRSSDNAEQDIGFVNNELDTASLTSFCGASNGYVTTWYDQGRGGFNKTQTNAVQQPMIVSSGSVLLSGSKPCMRLDGSDDQFITNDYSAGSVVITNVVEIISNVFGSLIGSIPDPSRFSHFFQIGSAVSPSQSNYGTPSVYVNGALANVTTRGDVANAYYPSRKLIYENNSNITGWGSIYHPRYNFFQYDIQENIIWDSLDISDRTDVETNINDYYGIY